MVKSRQRARLLPLRFDLAPHSTSVCGQTKAVAGLSLIHILLHSPTYIGFTSCVENNGYNIVHTPLVQDEDGVWRMDYEDMDRKLKQYKIHAAIFCSPHNPCGRVWERR